MVYDCVSTFSDDVFTHLLRITLWQKKALTHCSPCTYTDTPQTRTNTHTHIHTHIMWGPKFAYTPIRFVRYACVSFAPFHGGWWCAWIAPFNMTTFWDRNVISHFQHIKTNSVCTLFIVLVCVRSFDVIVFVCLVHVLQYSRFFNCNVCLFYVSVLFLFLFFVCRFFLLLSFSSSPFSYSVSFTCAPMCDPTRSL